MNFIQEVINIVSENEISDARVSLKKLLKELKNFQNDVRLYVDENYNEFFCDLKQNEIYLEQAEHLNNEVDNLVDKIETETKDDLLTAAEDIQTYIIELEELRIGLRINKRILKIDDLFLKLDAAKSNSEFSRLRDIINELREVIYEKEDEQIFRQLECYKNISIHWHIEHELLLNTLQDRFDQLVQLSEKTFQNTKSVNVTISKDSQALKEVIEILFESSSKGQRMCKFLMENVFGPIILKPVSLEVSESKASPPAEQSNDFMKLTVSFSTKPLIPGSDAISLRPNYKVVFRNIFKAFNCLKHLNVPISEDVSVFKALAENIKESFCKLLKDECLTYAIPDTIDDMNSSTLIADLTEFNAFLASSGFQTGDAIDNTLVEYTDRIDVIFKKRFCLNILKSAVDLMRKDLHDMQVADESVTGESFPSCMISRNTFELIDLMEKVLKEAVDSLNLYHDNNTVDDYVIDDLQARLRSTIPMILERYLTEVIEVHAKLIQTIPQQTALFHNNCMYLSWWLGRMGNQEGASFTLERSEVLSLELQELGSKYFANQIKNQRSQLIDILKDFGEFTDSNYSKKIRNDRQFSNFQICLNRSLNWDRNPSKLFVNVSVS